MAAMGSLGLLAPQDISGVYNAIGDGRATRRYARMLTRRADLSYEAYRDAMGGHTRDGQPMAERLLDLPEQAQDAWLRHSGDSGDEPVFDANGVWIPLPDEEGELRWGEMHKGAHHKYIARFPTGNPKRPWRYVYRYVHRATRLTTFDGEGKSHSRAVHSATLHDKPSRLLDSNQPIVVGMSFSDGVIGKHSGHWVVDRVTKNPYYPSLASVVVKHDVTGQERFFSDRFDLSDFIEGLHAEGINAESARRASVIARNQDEVFEQMEALAKPGATKAELERLSKLGYKLAKLNGDDPIALARRFKVSIDPPKNWAKARAELDELRKDLGVFCLDDRNPNYDRAVALMFVPDTLRQWIRFRVLQRWVDSHDDSLDAYGFLRRLMEGHRLTGEEDAEVVQGAVKKTLAVMHKDGSMAFKPGDVKALSGWDAATELLIDRDEGGVTDEGRLRGAMLKGALEDALAARKIAAPTVKHYRTDRPEIERAMDKAIDAFRVSPWSFPRPELLREPPDNVLGFNPLTYRASGILLPFSVSMQHLADSPERREFIQRHQERMEAIRSVVADVHSICAPLLEEHTEKSHIETEDHAHGGWSSMTVVDKRQSPAEVVLPLLNKALGIPDDAAQSNAGKLIPANDDILDAIEKLRSGPVAREPELFEADRVNGERLLAAVHPDLLPMVHVAHLPSMGRSYCQGDVVVLHANAGRTTLWHEVGHAIEHSSPEISQAMRAYLVERSGTSELTPLSRFGGYRDDEYTYPGDWAHPYIGKWYEYNATEILSMGVEKYLHSPVDFYRSDPEHFMMTVAALSGRFSRRDNGDSASGGPA